MPILVPVQTFDAPEGSVLGVLVGATDLTGNLTLQIGLRGRLDGETELTGSLAGVVSLAGQLDGDTELVPAFLRINNEANIFLAGQLNGATQMTGNLKRRRGLSGLLEGDTTLSGTLRVLHPEEASITILVDVLDSSIAAVENTGLRRYNARLLVDGEELPIRSATLEARAETLGTELRVALARPDADQVSFDSSITFQIGLWSAGAFTWLTVLSNGKLASRENPVRNEDRMPKDEMSITVVDVIADRWNRAPRAPVHLFDPFQVSAPDASQIESQTIVKQDGSVIVPVNVAIDDMTLRDVLHEAYVVGCDFSAVVSNLPNFPVAEADFTLDGGFDGAVRPLLQMFSPLVFEQNNILFIIDPDAPLPAGFTPRSFEQSKTRELNDSRPQRQPVNSILLKLRMSTTGGDFFTERLDTDGSTAGIFGTRGYTETNVEKRVREWRSFATPTIIVREEVVSEKTTVVDHEFNPIEITTLTQTFDALNRKTGHSRRVDKRLPDLNNDGTPTLLTDVTRQEQAITYRTNPLNPNEDFQDTVATVESGLILVDEDRPYLGEPYRLPLTEAHFSGYLDPDANQRVEQGDIKTTTEALRARGQQVDVEIRVINHLANAPTQTTITSRPGGIALDRRSQAATTRTLLLTIPGTESDGRIAQTFDAGILPAQLAIDLALRKLARLNNPASELLLTPAFVDVSIRRGSILAVLGRNDALVGNYIVEGYSITFEEFRREQGGMVATMSVTGRELQA